MATVRVHDGQSLFDVAIQTCGSIEAAFDIATLNGRSLTDILPPGLELAVPEAVNKDIANYYANRNITPATGTEIQPGGGSFDTTFDLTFDKQE